MARPKRSTNKPDGQLRIVGGCWRGRKLSFPAIEGLRPTPDRVRETLFNWLTPDIAGARCLDLFAGSGALGLEALSRGASWVDLVDAAAQACSQLRDNLRLLQADNGAVWLETAQSRLAKFNPGQDQSYDIVFLDPPFHQGLLAASIDTLESDQLLSPQASIYIETSSDEMPPPVPANWHLHREKLAGQVCYRLFKRNGQ